MNDITERAKKLVVRNHWIQVGRRRERERIINIINNMTNGLPVKSWNNTELWYLRDSIIKAIKEIDNGNSH